MEEEDKQYIRQRTKNPCRSSMGQWSNKRFVEKVSKRSKRTKISNNITLVRA